MIVVIVLFVFLMAAIVVPMAVTAVVRGLGQVYDLRRSAGYGTNDAVDARLTRIEEAIDAMAIQIDRMGQERRGDRSEIAAEVPVEQRRLGPPSGAA
jgi:hypothetical protein